MRISIARRPPVIRAAQLLCLMVMALMLAQCSHEPTVAIVRADGRHLASIRVEIANTEQERDIGLMYRRSLAANAGMLFVFAKPAHQAFWMHNTEIPLDMIFADSSGRIIGIIHDAVPYSDRNLSVDGLSKYVVEVNGGFCHRHGIKSGDHLVFTNFVPHASG